MSEMVRRRLEGRDLPRGDDKLERLILLTLNVVERISRDVRRAELITNEHVRLVEALNDLAARFSKE